MFCRQAQTLDDVFRTVLDEVNLQHERLVTVFKESRERHDELRALRGLEPDEEASASGWKGTQAEATELLIYHAGILRNKRLLFNYIKHRLDRIEDLRWTQRNLSEYTRANLSSAEIEYFKSYDKLLNQYFRSGSRGVGLDLTADPMPPDDPFVQVRVLKDYGEVVFSTGKVYLQCGKSHWLPRDEAHALLMDNTLEYA
ncbi:hypothetical protein H632_c398p2 [Helicosporidium sp. ATCC 50920]|nr:hypothetical protein H632_c398p2 [Helicosporidium sp. ATCC 50920]|eukprot:KDD76010.1 hypothetical protein H632_c398p2 [Helicosporidium sp. ATCC 50920]